MPCYYCGESMSINQGVICLDCTLVVCPKCGGCFCNRPIEEQLALISLRNKFCCDRTKFREGFNTDDYFFFGEDLRTIPYFEKSFNYCRQQLGVHHDF